jgi:predicted GNAT family N-acyltransferase
MSELSIRSISAAETRPLRQQLLRQNARLEDLVYPGDDAEDTLHVGGFWGDEMVGIASVYRMPPKSPPRPAVWSPWAEQVDKLWRLRAMATLPDVRGKGFGGQILQACIGYVAQQDGVMFWCDARVAAAGFYARYGFVIYGEEYHVPDVGPHYLMWRAVTPEDAALSADLGAHP